MADNIDISYGFCANTITIDNCGNTVFDDIFINVDNKSNIISNTYNTVYNNVIDLLYKLNTQYMPDMPVMPDILSNMPDIPDIPDMPNMLDIKVYLSHLSYIIIINLDYIGIIVYCFALCFMLGLFANLLINEILNIYTAKYTAIGNKIKNITQITEDHLQDIQQQQKPNEKHNKDYNKDYNIINSNLLKKINKIYFESILEVLAKNDEINSKIIPQNNYQILLRVVMKNHLIMNQTKYELHSNNINIDKNVYNYNTFSTRDMFMIINMKYYCTPDKQNIKVNIANSIVQCMNKLNASSPNKFKTTNFIIIAISKNNNNDSYEFNNGLNNINYEIINSRNIIIKSTFVNAHENYILLLPIHEVYDIFMDVYNNTIFESSKYVIDDNNYESWNGKSINDIQF